MQETRYKNQGGGRAGRKERESNKLLMIISSRILSESLKNNARNKTKEPSGGEGWKEEKRK